MTRRCTCDIPFCDGIECYLADPADHPKPIEEVSAPRPKFVHSPEYLAWIGKIDGDPLPHLEPLRRRA